ncbi:molecular chaperone [Pseudomonas capeferrum]|uniref:fimbrial biogenesis chaperone n=1 Tax=Pseudomonas capeferrum TaxID=1495066 RepID=UPI0015E330DD|nr:molecular chaperone [Pseudomonas capeferrum]MBA1205198.1 molecular chaperone [Pseudomonas capeferrum]
MLSITRTSTLLGGCLLALVCTLNSAHAALTISTTRIVYDSAQRSASVVIANPSQRPFAAQTWINTQADDTTTAVPFITAPALFRLSAGKDQTVQISGLPNDLPQDRESLFFFNLQEVPQASNGPSNVLNIALRTRIKLFYRPTQIQGDPVRSLKELYLAITRQEGRPHLSIRNPTPYHYTFSRLDIVNGSQQKAIPATDMLAPLSERSYALPAGIDGSNLQAIVTVINDYGGTSKPLTLPVHNTP